MKNKPEFICVRCLHLIYVDEDGNQKAALPLDSITSTKYEKIPGRLGPCINCRPTRFPGWENYIPN